MEYRFRRPIHPGRSSILFIIGADFLLGGGLFKELIHKLTLYVMYLVFSLGVASTFVESVRNCRIAVSHVQLKSRSLWP